MTTGFPKLSGYITEPEKICDELLLAVFASDYSQSNAFLGKVSSFQFMVHEAGENFRALALGLEGMFTDIFQRYFAIAAVNVKVTPIENDPARMSISMSATLTTTEGRKLDFQSAVKTAKGLATEILVGERQLWMSN